MIRTIRHHENTQTFIANMVRPQTREVARQTCEDRLGRTLDKLAFRGTVAVQLQYAATAADELAGGLADVPPQQGSSTPLSLAEDESSDERRGYSAYAVRQLWGPALMANLARAFRGPSGGRKSAVPVSALSLRVLRPR